MYWIDHRGTDPAFNLALEEVLLNQVQVGHPGFAMLWQNSPTIVVGRFQNARQEINQECVRERKLSVVRRMTGGGAVYHDAGTLNYTFITYQGQKIPSFKKSGELIANALHDLGLPVIFSGRNDLVLNGRKIAGVAYCRRGGTFLHHGCILVNSDLDVLGQALAADPEKFQSKGVQSVRARVGNLTDQMPSLTVDDLRQALLDQRSLYALTQKDLDEVRSLRESKYATWDWIWGASPPFSERKAHRFSWGKVEVLFQVQKGKVVACHFQGDFFTPADEEITHLQQALTGLSYTRSAFAEVLDQLPLQEIFADCDPEELKKFLFPE